MNKYILDIYIQSMEKKWIKYIYVIYIYSLSLL